MLDGTKDGLKTAAEQAVAEYRPEPAGGQSSLFPSEQLHELPAETGEALLQGLRKRGRGRPPQSQNKSTVAMRAFLGQRGRDPLVFLQEVYNRSVHDLADELGTTPLAALNLQIRAAESLAPYMHGKAPVIAADGTEMPTLLLADPRAWAALQRPGEGAELAALDRLRQMQQNQGVIDVTPGQVERSQLNAAPEAEADQCVSDGDALTKDQQA